MAKVRIYNTGGSEVVEECSGPTWAGRCPRVAAGAPVACAGRRIEVTNARELGLTVEPDAVSCPLAPLNLAGHFFATRFRRPGGSPSE